MAAIVAMAFSGRMLNLTPLMAEPWTSLHGIDIQQVGHVVSAEYAGMAVVILTAPLWVHRVSIKWIVLGSFALFLATDYFSFVPSGYYQMMGIRGLAGMGYGAVGACGTVMLANARNPDFAYGGFISLSFLTGAIVFFVAPKLVELYGSSGVKWGLVAPVIIGALSAPFLPHRLGGQDDAQASRPSAEAAIWNSRTLSVLASAAIIYILVMGLWTYIEQIGSGAGRSLRFIGTTLAIGQLAGIVVALFAASLRQWLGDRASVLTTGALALGSVGALFYAQHDYAFFTAAVVFNIVWCIAPTLLFGIITDITDDSRVIALFPLMQTVGLFLGPILMASLIVDSDFNAVLLASLLLSVLATILAVAACRGLKQSREQVSA